MRGGIHKGKLKKGRVEINKTEGKNNLSYLKVEITSTSISRKKSEHIVVYPFTRILLHH